MIARRLDSRFRRRGAVLVDAALVMLTFLTLVLGMIDLGIMAFRQQVVSRAARQGARLAIVHGSVALSSWNGGPWGTTAIDVKYADTSGVPIRDGLVNGGSLYGLDLTKTEIKVTWLDGSNDPEAANNRVQVAVITQYKPMMTFIFGSPTYTLSAASTMSIAH